MPAPVIYNVGAATSAATAITLTLPAGTTTNDIIVFIGESRPSTITVDVDYTMTGYAHVTGSPVKLTGGVATNSTALSVMWKRAGAAESNPSTNDTGDHNVGFLIGIRGCVTTGNPWDVIQTSTDLGTTASVSVTGTTTTVAETLVLSAVATGVDPASNNIAGIGSWANTSLESATEQGDNWTNTGAGGGAAAATGVKTAAGAVSATTATLTTGAEKAQLMMAFKAETVAGLVIPPMVK